MKNKKILLLTLFILVAIAQLWIPTSMILDKERILDEGEIIKLKLSSKNPVTHHNGSFLKLNFEENSFKIESDQEWERNAYIFIYYSIDSVGYARIDSISKTINEHSVDYIIAKSKNRNIFKNKLIINYPFNEYYIGEPKVKLAKEKIDKIVKKEDAVVYAEIAVLNGKTTLKNIFVNEKTLLGFLKE